MPMHTEKVLYQSGEENPIAIKTLFCLLVGTYVKYYKKHIIL